MLNAAGGEESRIRRSFNGMRIDLHEPLLITVLRVSLEFTVYVMSGWFFSVRYYKTVTCRG